MHINIQHTIKVVESMRINADDAKIIESGQLSHEEIQDAIRRENAIEKITDGLSELLDCAEGGIWRHFDELSVVSNKLKGKYALTGNYSDLVNTHAGYYFSQNEIRTKELDWFYADLLIAYSFKRQVTDSESWAGEVFAGAFLHGFLKVMEKQFLMAFILVVGKLFIWGIVCAAVVLPLVIADSAKNPVVGLLSAVVLFHILRVKFKKDSDYMALKVETFKNVWAINRVYSLTSSEHIHWEILGKELDSTREQGVKWLPSLYTAVKNVAT